MQSSDLASLTLLTIPSASSLALDPCTLQTTSAQNHKRGFLSKRRTGFVVLFKTKQDGVTHWRTRGFYSASSPQDDATEHTNHIYPVKRSGGENSDKETCGSNCFFQMQLEHHAC